MTMLLKWICTRSHAHSFLVGSAILEYKLLPVICFYKVKLSYHTKTAITRLRKALSAIAVFVF